MSQATDTNLKPIAMPGVQTRMRAEEEQELPDDMARRTRGALDELRVGGSRS